MPVYEYRCNKCQQISSFLVKTYGGSPNSGCHSCQSNELERIISGVAYLRSEPDKLSQLDPKYGKIVDQALSKAPLDTVQTTTSIKWYPSVRQKKVVSPILKSDRPGNQAELVW